MRAKYPWIGNGDDDANTIYYNNIVCHNAIWVHGAEWIDEGIVEYNIASTVLVYDTIPRGMRLTVPMSARGQSWSRPTRYKRWVEPIRVRDRRLFREAMAEVEQICGGSGAHRGGSDR